jgi:uncharacterized protein (TIGR03437 family)
MTMSGAFNDYPIPDLKYDAPQGITAGPDGALWFTEGTGIGRITTSGSVTQYSVGQPVNHTIVPGPDGALWFTGGGVGGYFIGRISTTGLITTYQVQSSPFPGWGDNGQFGIAKGPDNALWFLAFRKIGRITPSGAITYYPAPNVQSGANEILLGPDGALWFQELPAPNTACSSTCVWGYGRMTTDGKLSEYSTIPPSGLAYFPCLDLLGPDGAFYCSGNTTGVTEIDRVPLTAPTLRYSFQTPNSKTVPVGNGGAVLGPDKAIWLVDTGGLDRIVLTPPTIKTTTLPTELTGTNYSQPLAGSAVFGPLSWSASNVPIWLTLDPIAGSLSGTPPSVGTYNFSVTATDSLGLTATRSLTLVIQAGLQITTNSLPVGLLGTPYSTTLSAAGGTPPYSWSMTGVLPQGVSLASAGVLSGTPAAGGSYNFTVKVADSASNTASSTLALQINYPGGYTASPTISQGGVVSAGGLQVALRSGSWATVYGTNLAGSTRNWQASDFNGSNFPTSLDDVSLSIGGKSAFIRSIAPGQVNFQVPDGIVSGPVAVTVTNAAGTTAAAMADIESYAPAFFIGTIANSRNYAAATESDPQGVVYIGPAGSAGVRPAMPGDVLTLWGTGFGPTQLPVPSGAIFNGAAAMTDPVEILIDNMSVVPLFAGITGAGLYQFNVVMPDLQPGDHVIKATVAGASTPDGIWITTQ